MGKAQEIRAFTQEIRDFTMQRYQRHGIDSKAGVLAFLKKPTIPYSCTTAAQSLSTIQPPQAQETCPSTAAKRKRFIPLPSPLTQKEKATAFSFCNQGGSLALPLLALARRRDTTARHFSTLAHHEAGENRCELSLAFKKIDSASAEYMDCRALPSDKARNDDENAQILNKPTKDSRVCENAQSSNTPPQARANLDSSKSPSDSKILDEKCGLQGKSQGSYLNGNEQAPAAESRKSAAKPTPPTNQAAGGRIFDEKVGLCSDEQGDKTCGLSPQRDTNSPLFRKKPTPKPNKALHIDKEALSSLALVQEGLLAPISSLANSKTLHLDSYLTPFVLNPAGKRNRKVLESTKPNDVLDIVFEQKKVGYLRVEEVFPIDRHARTIQLTGLQGGAEFDRIYSRLGDLAVCGEYQVHFPDVKEAKASLQEQITAHNAKHTTGLVLDGQIFHKAHEALIRDALSMSDLVVLFLLKPYRHTIIHYDMQKECVELAMREYLMSDRICTIPLDDTYLFTGTNNVLLHAMVARNYGCTHFIVSDNTPNLSVFYERNTLYSVLDVVSGISTSIKGGYVYCDVCQMLVNRTTCPHGKHHHISYDTESILEFFKAGLLPPSVLVRPSISAKLIAHLFPNRFSNLQKLYYDLMPLNDGVLVPKSEEDFYLKLMQLYAIHSK